jgi:hypothetical protein
MVFLPRPETAPWPPNPSLIQNNFGAPKFVYMDV